MNRMQAALLESITTAKAADIVEDEQQLAVAKRRHAEAAECPHVEREAVGLGPVVVDRGPGAGPSA